MATFQKLVLSGSTGGQPVDVAATATPGTIIHATGTNATDIDEVWLYATNNDAGSADLELTIEFGGTATKDTITVTVPYQDGLTLVVPGLPLVGTGSVARNVQAFAPAGVSVTGYVNRIVA